MRISPSYTARNQWASGGLFHQVAAKKQSLGEMKPFLAVGEGFSKPAASITSPTRRQVVKTVDKGAVMIKTLSAVAVAALVAATLTILPGFAPEVAASVPQPLAKADRLDIRPIGRDCSQQAWPNFEASCLRTAGTKTTIGEARTVAVDRGR
jgi:hypothetical protein